ncbi:hypothetical protein BJ165DRAFT_1530390 [Panaeolus papilionaceus]|nr:hypothetical protein BJ165DRAFT_1530390 [Panaeolus papilionaceus]
MRFTTFITISSILTAALSTSNVASSLQARQGEIVVLSSPSITETSSNIRIVDLEDQQVFFQLQLNGATPGTSAFNKFTLRLQSIQQELQQLLSGVASTSANNPISTDLPIPLPSSSESVPLGSTSVTLSESAVTSSFTTSTVISSSVVITTETTVTEQQGTSLIVVTSQVTSSTVQVVTIQTTVANPPPTSTGVARTSAPTSAVSSRSRATIAVASETPVTLASFSTTSVPSFPTSSAVSTPVATVSSPPIMSQVSTRLEVSGNTKDKSVTIITSGTSSQFANQCRGLVAALVLGFWLWT